MMKIQNRLNVPPAAVIIICSIYLLLCLGLAALMAIPLLTPIMGVGAAILINAIVLLFVRSEVVLPLYLLVAGPGIALSLSGSGILSRLYIGNLLFFLVSVIWLLVKYLPERKTGRWLLKPYLLAPLLSLIGAGFISIVISHLAPDPKVAYTFAHASTSIYIVNAAEMMLLIGLPMFLVVVPGLVRSTQHAQWCITSYMIVGLLYALGTIFAAPLGLYSKEMILGMRRPEVFGSVSSGLGTLIVLFACIACARACYATGQTARLRWGILTGIFCLGVIMTFGRESWIALFLSLMTIMIVYTKKWKIPVIVTVILMPLFLISGASSFFDPSQTYGMDRFVIWQDAITIWQLSPIVGVGAGNYQFFDLTYGKDVVGIAHNQYLQVLAEMGIAGFLSLLWVMCMVCWVSIKSFREAKSSLGKSLALAYLGYFVAILFGGFFTSSFVPSAADGGGTEAFVGASYRWLLLGLVLSIPNWE